jgi:putative transposase
VGYDAGKKVKGRKLHALVDTEGFPLRVIVHSAGIQDRDGAALVFDKIRQRFNWLELVWADNGYNAWQVNNAIAANPGLRIEIVKRSDDMKGFVVLPRRWVVERTFSWFGRNRRLNKDYENLADTLLAFVTLAAIQFGIRRLASDLIEPCVPTPGAGGAGLRITNSADKKIRPLSDSRPPVRPPGEPTRTECMMANDLR